MSTFLRNFDDVQTSLCRLQAAGKDFTESVIRLNSMEDPLNDLDREQIEECLRAIDQMNFELPNVNKPGRLLWLRTVYLKGLIYTLNEKNIHDALR